jgi:hypothetical protein
MEEEFEYSKYKKINYKELLHFINNTDRCVNDLRKISGIIVLYGEDCAMKVGVEGYKDGAYFRNKQIITDEPYSHYMIIDLNLMKLYLCKNIYLMPFDEENPEFMAYDYYAEFSIDTDEISVPFWNFIINSLIEYTMIYDIMITKFPAIKKFKGEGSMTRDLYEAIMDGHRED